MKKARVTFLAVAEDEVQDVNALYSAEEQVKILNDVLRKGIIGSEKLDINIRYANREIVNENGVPEKIDTLVRERPSGLFECFHCGSRSVIWQSDFMFEECGYEGNGIVQMLTCSNCGADIEYRIPLDDTEDGEDAGE